MRRYRTLRHVACIALASVFVTAIACLTPLLFFWVLVLVRCDVPIPIQTGPDRIPHPVFDHPLFLPLSLFMAVLTTLMLGYVTARMLQGPHQKKQIPEV